MDTNLWQAGVAQRVKTKELRDFLKIEMAKLKTVMSKDRAEVSRLQEVADKYDIEAAAADADVVVIQAQLRSVIECVKAGKAMVSVSPMLCVCNCADCDDCCVATCDAVERAAGSG